MYERAIIIIFYFRFHDPSEEFEMNTSVVIPLNDDVRLSVDDYRNKLYELMSAHHHNRLVKNNQTLKLPRQNNAPRIIPDIHPKVMKDTERYLKSHYHPREKPHNTQSESKIYNKARLNQTTVNRSDSKLSRQIFPVPVEPRINKAYGDVRKQTHSSSEIQMKERYNRRTLNSKSHVYTSYNSYNQNHGIITQSALMELRAAGNK